MKSPVSSYQVLSRFDLVLGCKQKKATDVCLLSFQSFRKDCLEVFRKSMYVVCTFPIETWSYLEHVSRCRLDDCIHIPEGPQF